MNSVTDLAERATLGSILLPVPSGGKPPEWLRAEDFVDPWHRDVYAVLHGRHLAGLALDAPSTCGDLMTRVGPRRADLARLSDLLHVTPLRPDTDSYARIVLEASLRREVTGQGVLLRAAALASVVEVDARPAQNVIRMVDAALDALGRRWERAGTAPSIRLLAVDEDPRADRVLETAPAIGTAAARTLDLRLQADRFLSVHPAYDPTAAHDREIRFLAALIYRPSRIPAWAAILAPESISARPWRPVYGALVRMAETGQRVDAVTLAWEVQRASRAYGAGPGTSPLLEAVETSYEDPDHLGRLVAGDRLQRVADAGARALRIASDNPGVTVPDLIGTGRLVASAVRSAAESVAGPMECEPQGRAPMEINAAAPAASAPASVTGPVAG